MATVNDIVKRALRLLQVKEGGEPATDDEAKDGMEVLNNLLDSWANESLMLFTIAEHSFSFVAGQVEYTIGTGGNFNVTRPVTNGILNAFVRDTNNLDFKITEINNDQYNEIVLKSITSTYPLYFYFRDNYPLGVLSVWPPPSENLTFFINVSTQFTQFTAPADTVALPPGYVRALEYNLAVEIGPEYIKSSTAANFQVIQKLAMEAKEKIKDTNDVNVPVLKNPAANIGSNLRGNYNWWWGFSG